MRVAIGTLNKAKISGVEKAFKKYFREVKVIPVKVDSHVSPQPMELNEVIEGAKYRAIDAAEHAGKWDFSVGVEAGMLNIKRIWIDLQIAYIIDSNNKHSIGFSPGFPVPKKVIDKLLSGEYRELEEVVDKYFKTENIGEKEGFIGILTKNIVDRAKLTYYAVVMALVPYINTKLYFQIR